MENLIGKRFYKLKELEYSGVLKEYAICDYEVIDDKIIVYTTNSKSFLLDDLKISPYQLIDDLVVDSNYKSYIRSMFNQNTNYDKMSVLLEKKDNQNKKIVKTFKIFGWTITFSKSK
jgi:hypothetical protein